MKRTINTKAATSAKKATKGKGKAKIEKDMNLGALVLKYPNVEEILVDYGLHCSFCVANSFDTIEMGAKVHGLSDDDVDDMIIRINEMIEYGE